MMDFIVTVLAAVLAAVLAVVLIEAWKRFKRRIMSDSQVEQEIAKVCRRKGMYEFKSGGDLGYISDQLIKIKPKDRLPEEFRSENRDYRVAALFRFLIQRGWKSGQENHGTCRIIYKLPDKYRSP